MNRVVLVTLGGLALALAGPLDWCRPHSAVLQITETTVKRMGTGDEARDVYFISTTDLETDAVRVFRNEDTGWGFPPYLKFSSADIQARADQLKTRHGLAEITWYGWRVQMASAFPNVVDLKPVSEVYTPLPVTGPLLGLGLLAGLVGLGRLLTRRRKPVSPAAEELPTARATPAAPAAHRSTPVEDWIGTPTEAQAKPATAADWLAREDRT